MDLDSTIVVSSKSGVDFVRRMISLTSSFRESKTIFRTLKGCRQKEIKTNKGESII